MLRSFRISTAFPYPNIAKVAYGSARSERLASMRTASRTAHVTRSIREHANLWGSLRCHAERRARGCLPPAVFRLPPLGLPSYSNRSQYLREQRLLLQHGAEAFHQRAQPALRHGGDKVVKHAALTEQG